METLQLIYEHWFITLLFMAAWTLALAILIETIGNAVNAARLPHVEPSDTEEAD